MGQFHTEIPEFLMDWLVKQQMFWVASAPLSIDGHVNISPKAIEGTFHVVNNRRVWYEDLSGTGAETVSHIRENGRITILFHAFEGPARIVRLYGKGFFYEIGSPEYEALLPPGKRIPGSRAVIGLDITKVGTTCGYAVPYYQFIGHRSQLVDWAARKEAFDQDDQVPSNSGALVHPTSLPVPPSPTLPLTPESQNIPWTDVMNPKGMIHWWQGRNLVSIDGLPAFSGNLGRGFPFGWSLRPSPTQMRATSSRRPATNAVYTPPAAVKLPLPAEQRAIIDTLVAVKKPRFPDVLSSLLPFIFTLIIGIFLGRIYQDHLHHPNAIFTAPSRWQAAALWMHDS